MSTLVLVLALLVAPEDAQKRGAAPSSAAKAGARPAATAAPSRTIVGEIVWVDFPSRLVLVRESVKTTAVKGKAATRETIALAVAADVPVIRGKEPSTFAELKPKDHVVARYLPTPDGAKAVSLRVADGAGSSVLRPAPGTPPVPAGTTAAAN